MSWLRMRHSVFYGVSTVFNACVPNTSRKPCLVTWREFRYENWKNATFGVRFPSLSWGGQQSPTSDHVMASCTRRKCA